MKKPRVCDGYRLDLARCVGGPLDGEVVEVLGDGFWREIDGEEVRYGFRMASIGGLVATPGPCTDWIGSAPVEGEGVRAQD